VLFPFLPTGGITAEVTADLQTLIATFPTFGFQLTHVECFPDVLYLRPEPEESFRELTTAVVDRWPECPPYGGAFENVIPHLTIAALPAPPSLRENIARILPLTAFADELWLMRPDATGRWVQNSRFPLRADPHT
jgi:hypothetical protein